MLGDWGMEVLLSGDEHHEGFKMRLPWSELQPFEKPALNAAREARVRWRFHCIDVRSDLSEWRKGRDNRWDIEASECAEVAREWHTGHLEVAMSFTALRRSTMQLAEPSCRGPQLLYFSRDLHLCLEHRAGPLACFGGGSAGPHVEAGLWPSHVQTWPSEEAYSNAWRRLCFMEAVDCGVSDNDAKVLGGIDIDWVSPSGGHLFGSFALPRDFKDAHQVKLRANDLLCIRWRPGSRSEAMRPRAALIADVFASLNSSGTGFLGAAEMRPFAERAGFEEGSDAAWADEFAALCRELGCEEHRGIDAETFAGLVNDASERGCLMSDDELEELAVCVRPQAAAKGGEPAETWVVHAVVQDADTTGDTVQVRLRPCLREDSGGGAALPGPPSHSRMWRDCVVELISLPESYHYAAAALADLPMSRPIVRDLVLRGGVAAGGAGDGRAPPGMQDLVYFKLNESQEQAVRAALTEPVALIHGPPGTGKTRTAAALALTFARQNAAAAQDRACVLYSASGNRAVDVAVEAIDELSVERLEDLFQSRSDEGEICSICWSEGCNVITFCGHVFHHHCLKEALRAVPRGGPRQCPLCRAALKALTGVRLLRIYSSDTERLEFPVPRKFEYEGVQDRRRRTVAEEMRRFALHWRIHGAVPGHSNPFAADCGAAYEALVQEGVGGPGFDEARAKYNDLRKKARAFELRTCNVLLTTNCSCRRSWVVEMLQQEGIELRQVIEDEAGTTPEPEALCPLTLARQAEHIVLVGDYRQLRPVVKNRDAAALGLGRSLFERLSGLVELGEADATATCDAPGGVAVADGGSGRPAEPQDRAALMRAAFAKLDVDGAGALGRDALRAFATFTGFEGKDEDWDCEYEALCAHLGCDPSVGVDFDGFCRSVDDDSDDGCHCSDEELRELAGEPAAPQVVLKRPASVLLKQQYRMHPAMNRFPSQHFYGGQVGDDISTHQRLPGILVHPRTQGRCAIMFWCSPASFREEVQEVASREASTRSKANAAEAARCAQLVERMVRAGARSMAVLSWYNAQVAELRRLVHALPGCKGVHIGSVVTAQGSEWDYVLLSTVRTAGPAAPIGAGSQAQQQQQAQAQQQRALGCLADRHLLNVAVTRGRLGIVVLGSPEALRSNRHWAAFLSHCEEEQGMVSAEDHPHFLLRDPHPLGRDAPRGAEEAA